MEHPKATLYAIWYIHSASDLGTHFSSYSDPYPHTQIHHHFIHDKNTYVGASASTLTSHHELTDYLSTCWISQVESTTKNVKGLWILKYFSINEFIIFQCGGSVIWKPVHQPHTILSSCDAEIWAINECTKMIQHLWHVLANLSYIDLSLPTKFSNDNHACADWSK